MSKKFIPVTDERAVFTGGGANLLGPTPVAKGWQPNFIGKDSVKNGYQGFTLPSYDIDISEEDSAFSTSVMPFWTGERDPNNKKHYQPSYWAIVVGLYSFFGPDKLHFMSPETKKILSGGEDLTARETADPITDLRKHMRAKLSKEEFTSYTKREFLPGQKNEDPPLPSKASRYAMLDYAKNAKDATLRKNVDLITPGAYNHIIKQCREINLDAAAAEIVDARYPHYTFGDPTKVEGAMRFVTRLVATDPNTPNKETNCLMYSEDGQNLDNDWQNKMMKITKEMLESRFVMWDISSWHFLSYQEIVDIMVDQLVDVPLEFIQEACGHMADVPDQRVVRKVKKKDDEEETDDEEGRITANLASKATTAPVSTTQTSTPPLPAAATPPPPAAPVAQLPPPPADVEETIAVAGGQPFQVGRRKLEAGLYQDHYVLRNNAWAEVKSLFPATPAVPSLPAVPATPTVPSTPAVPVASGPVQQAGVSEADVLASRQAVVPDEIYAKQKPEVKAECDRLFLLIAERKITGATPTPEESKALSALIETIIFD